VNLHYSNIMNFTQLSLFFKPLLKPTPKQPTPRKRKSTNRVSDPKLFETWKRLQESYFPDSLFLNEFKVCWSNRHQTSCLASVNLQTKIVRVAPAMKLPESQLFLEPLLYHEMCHAIVGIKVVRGRRKIHSREFKNLENLHPHIKFLDIWIKNGGWSKAVKLAKKQKNIAQLMKV